MTRREVYDWRRKLAAVKLAVPADALSERLLPLWSSRHPWRRGLARSENLDLERFYLPVGDVELA